MAKNRMACVLFAAALIVGSGVFAPFGAFAEPTTLLESCDDIEHCAVVTSTAELEAAFTAEDSTIIVGESFDLTADVRPNYNFALYLNNYTITSSGYSFVQSGIMTIYGGEEGKIKEVSGDWAPLYIYGGLVLNGGTIEAASIAVYVSGENVEFVMNGGKIDGGSSTVVTVNVTDGAKMTMNNGEIDGDTWGVAVFKDSEFVMNGGIITAESDEGIGVAGNGSVSGNNEGTNAKLTLNAGTINSGDLGVYAPQINGRTVLGEGLAINAGKCGVEIRAGELSVEGATINVNAATPYEFNPNGSGSTASGVAIAVAQHTTQQAITATVSDGVFTAPVAFAEGNPQHNPEEAVEQVELSITGGEFNATNGEPVVASEDVEGFITGGRYNKEPDVKYIVDGYRANSVANGTSYIVLPISDTAIADDTGDENTDEIQEELGNVAQGVLDALYNSFNDLTGDGPLEIVSDDGLKFLLEYPEYAREALENGHTIVTVLDSDEIDLNDLDDGQKAELEELLEDGMVPFGLIEYWIDLNETDGAGAGSWLGAVTEIPHAIELTYDASEAPELAEGVTRVWKVLRIHGDDVDVLDAEYDPETKLISFATNKFSAFVITYTDVAAAPDTGTMTMMGASAMSASIIAAVVTGVLVAIVAFVKLIKISKR